MGPPDLPNSSDLLPSQWRDMREPSEAPPLNRLFLALLDDALHCWQIHHPPPLPPNSPKRWDLRTQRCQRLFSEADLWIFHPEIIAPFSFDDVCDVLNLAPGRLRAGLERWREAMMEGSVRKVRTHRDHGRPTAPLAATRPRHHRRRP